MTDRRRPSPFVALARIAAVAVLLAGAGACTMGRGDDSDLVGLWHDISRSPGDRINGDLWRAALDSMDFMEPWGDSSDGILVTPWQATPEAPNERFKVRVFVSGPDLRRDNVRVTVNREVRDGGAWREAKARADTARQLEDVIYQTALSYARRAGRP